MIGFNIRTPGKSHLAARYGLKPPYDVLLTVPRMRNHTGTCTDTKCAIHVAPMPADESVDKTDLLVMAQWHCRARHRIPGATANFHADTQKMHVPIRSSHPKYRLTSPPAREGQIASGHSAHPRCRGPASLLGTEAHRHSAVGPGVKEQPLGLLFLLRDRPGMPRGVPSCFLPTWHCVRPLAC